MSVSTPERALVSVIVVLHLAVVGTSALLEVGVTALEPVRAWTRPWEQALGVHQNWPMFVEPARATGWLVVTGERPDGGARPFPELGVEPVEANLAYDRVGKLTRSATSSKREFLRTALVRWACRAAAAEGDPLRRVTVARWSRQTPEPWTFEGAPRSEWPARHRDETWNCPR